MIGRAKAEIKAKSWQAGDRRGWILFRDFANKRFRYSKHRVGLQVRIAFEIDRSCDAFETGCTYDVMHVRRTHTMSVLSLDKAAHRPIHGNGVTEWKDG